MKISTEDKQAIYESVMNALSKTVKSVLDKKVNESASFKPDFITSKPFAIAFEYDFYKLNTNDKNNQKAILSFSRRPQNNVHEKYYVDDVKKILTTIYVLCDGLYLYTNDRLKCRPYQSNTIYYNGIKMDNLSLDYTINHKIKPWVLSFDDGEINYLELHEKFNKILKNECGGNFLKFLYKLTNMLNIDLTYFEVDTNIKFDSKNNPKSNTTPKDDKTLKQTLEYINTLDLDKETTLYLTKCLDEITYALKHPTEDFNIKQIYNDIVTPILKRTKEKL